MTYEEKINAILSEHSKCVSYIDTNVAYLYKGNAAVKYVKCNEKMIKDGLKALASGMDEVNRS